MTAIPAPSGGNPALISAIIFIQRIWDGMLDPLFGQFRHGDSGLSPDRAAFRQRRTLEIACYLLVVDCVAKYWLYQPGQAWLPLVVIIMNGIASSGVSLMCIAMLGDIADQDEYHSGLRREGLFVALLAWFEKAGNSLGSFLTGFLLVWIGFEASTGVQTFHTLWLMKWSYMVFPAAGALLTLFLHQPLPPHPGPSLCDQGGIGDTPPLTPRGNHAGFHWHRVRLPPFSLFRFI